jgi:hypothetical protein
MFQKKPKRIDINDFERLCDIPVNTNNRELLKELKPLEKKDKISLTPISVSAIDIPVEKMIPSVIIPKQKKSKDLLNISVQRVWYQRGDNIKWL